MAIVYVDNEDVVAPIVVCDQCGERITEGMNGAVVGSNGHEARFVHKGACDTAFAAAHPEYGSGWDELSDLPILLAWNIGLDLRDAQKRAEHLRRSGLTN